MARQPYAQLMEIKRWADRGLCEVLEGSLDGADGPASIFIDIIGMPRTPASFAGVARRTAYRGAWYAGAAGAAYAAAPYYRPYAPPPPCGYYPYPPCY